MSENFIRYPNDKYNEGVILDEYNGEFSLCLAQEGKDGKVYKKWCFPQRRVDGENVPSEKGVPWKVKLGERHEALAMLQHYLSCLGAPPNGTEQEDDNIPF